MRRLFSALFVITAIGIQAVDIYTEDDFQVADEPYDDADNLLDAEGVRSAGDARPPWPYPLKADANREARFAHYSYPRSPLVDMMLQTVAVNYSPVNSNDPFDFLRDSYPLPKGERPRKRFAHSLVIM